MSANKPMKQRGRPRKTDPRNCDPRTIAFADALRQLRVVRNESQQVFAERLGMTQSTLSNLESGWYEPWPDDVFKFEKRLGIPPGYLSTVLGYLPVTTEKETHGQPISR